MQNVPPADDFESNVVADDGAEDLEQEEGETAGFFDEDRADEVEARDEEGERDAVLISGNLG